MTQLHLSLSHTVWSATLAGMLVCGLGGHKLAQASSTSQPSAIRPNPWLVGVHFEAPGEAAPPTSIGGGVRGSVQFAAPGEATPNNSVGGGVRGDVQFASPGEATPNNSVGGGVRGDVQFASPGGATPNNSVGGGVRGQVEFSAPGEATPNNSVGGGVRGEVEFSAPGEATPNSSVGGGVRGALPTPTALLPPTQHGKTVSARPTFYVYLPPTASSAVFFSVQDEEGNTHYHSILEISGEGGVMGLTLPTDAPELEIGKNYLWAFAPIEPNGTLRPDNFSIVGWVKRVEPTLSDGDSTLTPVEQATAYAASGLWYDTLEVLASAQLEQPEDDTLAEEWKDLLEQVGLEAIATEPIFQLW